MIDCDDHKRKFRPCDLFSDINLDAIIDDRRSNVTSFVSMKMKDLITFTTKIDLTFAATHRCFRLSIVMILTIQDLNLIADIIFVSFVDLCGEIFVFSHNTER